MADKKWSAQEMFVFCSQMALILKSGLPLYEGLRSIAQTKQQKELEQLADAMTEGAGLEEALRSSGRCEEPFLQMVAAGERSGYLDQIMEANAIYYHRMYETNKKLQEQMLYPLLLGTLLLAVMGIVVLFALPLFQNLLAQLGTGLPHFAIQLMDIARYAGSLGLFLVLLLLLAAIFWYIQKKGSSLQYRFPFMKQLQFDLDRSQLTYALSLLISSGYEIDDTLRILKAMVTSPALQQKLDICTMKMKSGTSFAEALLKENIYDGIEGSLLLAGWKSGNMEVALKQMAALYEEQVNDEINTRLDSLVPAATGLLSLFTGILLITIMLPLISILSSLG